MALTTLVTFLVRTPPSTKSVFLYGSWDNFSTPYPMQRDARTGPEHWSGCHSFSNIICDGDLQLNGVPREGGLKMGGTYWYYYKLDDDLEFHNSAEPSTTSCPMLPGQLVNVLNVPFALSSGRSRSRNDSLSSTSSEIRTMEPTDKLLNPRPVPAKPVLPRLKTSPTLPQNSWSAASTPLTATSRRGRSASSRAQSPPASANALRIVRLATKPSVDASSRSTSRSSNRSVGIIGAFRALASPHVATPDGLERGRSVSKIQTSSAAASRSTSGRSKTPKERTFAITPSPVENSTTSPAAGPGDLVLRRGLGQGLDDPKGLGLSSFGQHRENHQRQRSSSREPSSLRHLVSPGASEERAAPEPSNKTTHNLETLEEVASPAATPGVPITARKVQSDLLADNKPNSLDLEKRLPTLPNTPSSAYPPSEAEHCQTLDDVDNLQSRFSSTTIDTESYTDSYMHADHSRFSAWTYDTINFSPQSEFAFSVTNEETTSPETKDESRLGRRKSAELKASISRLGTEERAKQAPITKQNGLPSALSTSTISSVPSTTPSSASGLDSAKEFNPLWSKFEHYSLPKEEISSGVTLKPASSVGLATPLVVDGQDRPGGNFPPSIAAHGKTAAPHSTGMQQLLDELSYLGGMIQQH